MHAIASSTTGTRRLFISSIVARLPLTMFSIGLLVHARHLTGSFAVAGIVTGAYAVALGAGGPLLAALVDRRGQTVVLLVSALATTAFAGATAVLPVGAPVPVLVALAAAIGLATPPLGACLRALLPGLLPDAEALRTAYAVESAASELTWIAGPPLALGVGALWSTGAALAVAGAVLLAGTVAFAVQPASRRWRPAPAAGPRPRGGSLGTPAMRTLVIVLVAVGVLFGAAEVAVAAATELLGSAAAAGPLLGLWGLGSLAGGVLAVRLGRGAGGATGLTVMLAALAAGHLALAAAAGSIVALGAVLIVAGAAIAPTYATVYAMVDEAAPAGTVTEAFAWLGTAVAIGASAGAAGAGALADSAGPAAAFVLAGGAGALALLTAALRSRTLAGAQSSGSSSSSVSSTWSAPAASSAAAS
jgi:MFS family permease